MSSVTINSYVFQCQEDNLAHLATALDVVSTRVLLLTDLVKTCGEKEQDQLERATSELCSVLHCLGVVADAAGSNVARWRAWANKADINITYDLNK